MYSQATRPTARTVRSLCVFTILITGLITGAILYAGPLNPPAGPVASTHKTLTEVEPRTPLSQAQVPITISQPGSYYLTGNLFAPVLITAIITVNAPGVTLDLNGFQLDGATDVGEATYCIRLNAVAEGCAIRNGTVMEATTTGISSLAAGCSFTNVRATRNAAAGLSAGNGALVEGCTASNNGTVGISAGSASVVRGCTAADNGSNGISATGTVDGCTGTGNGQSGFSGAGIFTRCVANSNSLHGFSVTGGLISECRASLNTQSGISAINQAFVTRCTCDSNGGSGITVSLRCTALENNCSMNTASGIASTVLGAGWSRIEGNTLAFNNIGISASNTRNIIIRNMATLNGGGNYSIVAGNSVGQILDVTGLDITTTNPYRNLEY
mgnify:CR=1 FL=1